MVDDLKLFVQVAQQGSFAAAARQLGVVPSTVSKRIAALEEHFDARLIQRTTRTLSLTAEGRTLLDEARPILARLQRLEERLTRRVEEPVGTLRITTIHAFGQLHLARLLPRFHQRYPEIRVELSLSDRVVDLVEESFDVAIRFGVLPDSSLRARRLGRNLYRLCASPEYLARRGRPSHPRELEGHACLTDQAYPPLRTWVFSLPGGERVEIEPDGPLQTEDPVARYYATLHGMGIAALPAYVAGDAVARGDLEVLFGAHPLDLGYIWALHVSRDRVPRRVEAFLEFTLEELGQDGPG